MSLRRISDPLTREKKLSVVSVPDVKAQARITTNDEDGLIADYIETAFDYLSGPEGWLNGYALLEETFELKVPARSVSCGFIELPMRPFLALVSVERLDTGATYVPLLESAYSVLEQDVFDKLALSDWGRGFSYRIRFKAGHIRGSLVPSPLRQSINMLVAHWLNNRETVGKVGSELEYGLKALARHYWIARDHS